MPSPEFKSAKDLQPIVDRIVELFYPLLQGCTIRVAYQSKNFPDRSRTVARIYKVTGWRAWLWDRADGEPEAFFLIIVAVPNWITLEPRAQIAVLDHEVCHIEYNEETDSLALRDHSIEEFPEVVERHGAYHAGLEHFYHALERGESDDSTCKEMIDRLLNG